MVLHEASFPFKISRLDTAEVKALKHVGTEGQSTFCDYLSFDALNDC